MRKAKPEVDDGSEASVWTVLREGRLWLLVLSGLLFNLGNSFGLYWPSLARTLAGSREAALLISLPPFLLAALVGWSSGRASDQSGCQCVVSRSGLR